MTICCKDAVSETEAPETGAPDEIEVTPEMAKAGASVLVGWNPNYDSAETIAEIVFQAMIEASNSSKP